MKNAPTYGIGDPCKVHPTKFDSWGGEYLYASKGVCIVT